MRTVIGKTSTVIFALCAWLTGSLAGAVDLPLDFEPPPEEEPQSARAVAPEPGGNSAAEAPRHLQPTRVDMPPRSADGAKAAGQAPTVPKSGVAAAPKKRARRKKRRGAKIRVPKPYPLPGSGQNRWTEPITGMEFVRVKGGCFSMGCGVPSGEGGKRPNAWSTHGFWRWPLSVAAAVLPVGCVPTNGGGDALASPETRCFSIDTPVHEVCVSEFWIGAYEVSQAEWRSIMEEDPSVYVRPEDEAADYPVDNVSWNMALEFAQRLAGLSGQQFMLPTEAQWEYACQGGARETYCGGDNINVVAWHKNNVHTAEPQKRGTRQPNQIGVHDMSGNVWEWCADWFDPNYYRRGAQRDPAGPESGTMKVLRGGSVQSNPRFLKASARFSEPPSARSSTIGLRLVFLPAPVSSDQ